MGGTNPVTIAGSGFTAATSVTFGSVPAVSFRVVNDGKISAVAPAQAPGPVDVHVTTAGGPSPAAPADVYRYDAIPFVMSISPAQASASGGDTVVLHGSGFTGATAVTFGSTAAAAFTVVDDATMRVVTPAHAAGGLYVQVSRGGVVSPVNFWQNWFVFQVGSGPR